jgi:hypothetical protein
MNYQIRKKLTFIEWLYLLKFNKEHFMITEGVYSDRFNDNMVNGVYRFTISNKNGDLLKTNNLEYKYFFDKIWKLN